MVRSAVLVVISTIPASASTDPATLAAAASDTAAPTQYANRNSAPASPTRANSPISVTLYVSAAEKFARTAMRPGTVVEPVTLWISRCARSAVRAESSVPAGAVPVPMARRRSCTACVARCVASASAASPAPVRVSVTLTTRPPAAASPRR